DDAEVVDHAADLREEIADLGARLAEALEVELRSEADERAPLKLGDLLALGKGLRHRLAVHVAELGLGVEGFQVRRTTGLVEEDDAFGALGEVERTDDALGGGVERTEGHQSEAGRGLREEG